MVARLWAFCGIVIAEAFVRFNEASCLLMRQRNKPLTTHCGPARIANRYPSSSNNGFASCRCDSRKRRLQAVTARKEFRLAFAD